MLIKKAGAGAGARAQLKDFDISQDIPPASRGPSLLNGPILDLAINNNPKSIEICGQWNAMESQIYVAPTQAGARKLLSFC